MQIRHQWQRQLARRAMARYALDRGLMQRRADWLFSTPQSAIHYRSKRARRDRHLSAALRIVGRDDPSWGYHLAAGYLPLRGWQVNDKRVYRLWRLKGRCIPPFRPSRKIRTGTELHGLALRRNDVCAWEFVHDRYHDSEPSRCLTVKDEATGYGPGDQSGSTYAAYRRRGSAARTDHSHGRLRAVRSDNGSELLAQAL